MAHLGAIGLMLIIGVVALFLSSFLNLIIIAAGIVGGFLVKERWQLIIPALIGAVALNVFLLARTGAFIGVFYTVQSIVFGVLAGFVWGYVVFELRHRMSR